MTDKVHKIEKWIKEKISYWYYESLCEVPELPKQIIEGKILALREMLSFINSLQEEPVSIWHDSSEEPNDKSSCLIHYIVGGKVSYRDIFPVLYNKEAREFVSEPYPHPTGYNVEQSSLEGGVVAEVYKDMRDRFPISDIYKWAYVDDILNLSNVERTVKNWKEPVSEDLKAASYDYVKSNHKDIASIDDCALLYDAIEFGAKWKEEQMMKDVMPCVLEWYDGFVLNFTEKQLNDVVTKNNINIGDKVKLIVIKED